MKIEIKELEGCKRQLDFEIPSEVINREINLAAQEMARVARIPGFRPGKVPQTLIKQRFKNELRQDVLKNLLPSALEAAVEQHDLNIAGEPNVDKLEFADDGTLSFSVLFEVMPDFELAEYRALPVEKHLYKVTDEDVSRVVDSIREDAAELIADDAEDRVAHDGDFLSIDLEGKYLEAEGHEHHHEPLKADDVSVEIGSKTVQSEFSDNLRGMKVGESKTFPVTYPEKYPAAELAGHTVEYTARVAAIRTKEVPEFDDAFASEYGDGEYESADKLRTAIRENLERQADMRTRNEFDEAVIDAVLAANHFPVPEVMVEEQTKSRLDNMMRTFKNQGVDPRTMNVDWRAVIDSQRKVAERDIRGGILIGRIAESERIDPSDEDVDAEFERIAEVTRQPVAQVRARLTKGGGADSIKNRIRYRKALDLVADAARVTVKEIAGLGAETDTVEGATEGGDTGQPRGIE